MRDALRRSAPLTIAVHDIDPAISVKSVRMKKNRHVQDTFLKILGDRRVTKHKTPDRWRGYSGSLTPKSVPKPKRPNTSCSLSCPFHKNQVLYVKFGGDWTKAEVKSIGRRGFQVLVQYSWDAVSPIALKF